MSRDNLTNDMAAASQDRLVRPALLFFADFPSQPTYAWSGYGTLQWNGHDWTGTGTFLTLSEIEETQEMKATGIGLSLSNVPADLVPISENEDYQGRTLEIYLMLFEEDGTTIIQDPIMLFRGRMDQMEAVEDVPTAIINMTVESRLVDMDRAREGRYTDQDQKMRFPGDRGLEAVAALQDRKVNWTKGGAAAGD